MNDKSWLRNRATRFAQMYSMSGAENGTAAAVELLAREFAERALNAVVISEGTYFDSYALEKECISNAIEAADKEDEK
jgi:hypothetical protein